MREELSLAFYFTSFIEDRWERFDFYQTVLKLNWLRACAIQLNLNLLFLFILWWPWFYTSLLNLEKQIAGLVGNSSSDPAPCVCLNGSNEAEGALFWNLEAWLLLQNPDLYKENRALFAQSKLRPLLCLWSPSPCSLWLSPAMEVLQLWSNFCLFLLCLWPAAGQVQLVSCA